MTNVLLRLMATAALSTWPLSVVLAESRQWTDVDGRTVSAEFAGIDGEQVLLRMDDGRELPFPMEKLSAADQDLVKRLQTDGGMAVRPGPPRVPIAQRVWPEVVEVDSRAVEIEAVEESEPLRNFVYESQAFQFTSQAKLAGSVMKEVARTFESTRELVSKLPWGVVCIPPDGQERYLAALYETREDYFRAGGPENSGGVYMSGEKIFKIPFPSLGLERRGRTFFMDDGYSNDTLVHELTHQMMHDYLPFLPKWVIEGTAEYTELLPYNAGTFRAGAHKTEMKRHIDECVARGLPVDVGSVESHLTMTRDGWTEASAQRAGQAMVYFRSVLMVYFFSHLDGDGKGTRFLKFMDAVRDEAESLIRFFADPRVKQFPDGRFSYPEDMEVPDLNPDSAPFKHLDLLLDGRSYEQLAGDVVAGFKSIGEKVEVQP